MDHACTYFGESIRQMVQTAYAMKLVTGGAEGCGKATVTAGGGGGGGGLPRCNCIVLRFILSVY